MPRLIYLVGLCGAGKTRKATRMEREDGFVWIDSVEHQLPDGSKPNYEVLLQHLKAGRNCVAEELQALTSKYRTQIEADLKRQVPGLDVAFWFFEKDIVKATNNVLSRPDDKKRIADHLLINGRIYDCYDLPCDPNTVILPIEPPTSYDGTPEPASSRTPLVLSILLRFLGVTALFALVAVFMPFSWMAATHRWLGLGEMPTGPVVEYLARSVSAFYAFFGAPCLVLAGDIERYRPVVCVGSA
jgi:hypothetical protein